MDNFSYYKTLEDIPEQFKRNDTNIRRDNEKAEPCLNEESEAIKTNPENENRKSASLEDMMFLLLMVILFSE